MRVSFSSNRRLGHALGSIGVLAALAFAPSAQALELRDIQISFPTKFVYESPRDDGSVYRAEYNSSGHLTAIAGSIVMFGVSTLCHDDRFDLVYRPGAHSGTVSCPVKRVGTPTSWIERSGSATFSTNTIVAGNVVTLQGTMEAKGTITTTNCVGPPSSHYYTHRITQSLKIRIVGRTCQVLQFHQIATETDSENPSITKTTTTRLVPGARCTLIRPSEQPPAGPPPAFGSARGNC